MWIGFLHYVKPQLQAERPKGYDSHSFSVLLENILDGPVRTQESDQIVARPTPA